MSASKCGISPVRRTLRAEKSNGGSGANSEGAACRRARHQVLGFEYRNARCLRQIFSSFGIRRAKMIDLALLAPFHSADDSDVHSGRSFCWQRQNANDALHLVRPPDAAARKKCGCSPRRLAILQYSLSPCGRGLQHRQRAQTVRPDGLVPVVFWTCHCGRLFGSEWLQHWPHLRINLLPGHRYDVRVHGTFRL